MMGLWRAFDAGDWGAGARLPAKLDHMFTGLIERITEQETGSSNGHSPVTTRSTTASIYLGGHHFPRFVV
jgi:hypothetical protein